VDGQPTVGVQCDPVELLRFLSRDFTPMNIICDRGQMSERGIYDRSKAVFEHFGLPFDAEPPAPASSVAPHPVPRQPKIGRNDPCSCGSGKKYKRCCGKG
jgi:hypothetical protein